jgi:hypothetical protein
MKRFSSKPLFDRQPRQARRAAALGLEELGLQLDLLIVHLQKSLLLELEIFQLQWSELRQILLEKENNFRP